MSMTRKPLLAAALAGAAVLASTVAPAPAAAGPGGDYKLEGACIAKVPGMPMQWSYVLVPDNSGRRASLHGTIEVGLNLATVTGNPALAGLQSSPLLGAITMTGPTTGKFRSVWYVLSPSAHPMFTNQVVFIGVNTGEIEFIGPGRVRGTHHMAFYLPSSDEDGDGLPDAGKTPAIPLPPIVSVDTCL